jgi:hypothetical protein
MKVEGEKESTQRDFYKDSRLLNECAEPISSEALQIKCIGACKFCEILLLLLNNFLNKHPIKLILWGGEYRSKRSTYTPFGSVFL